MAVSAHGLADTDSGFARVEATFKTKESKFRIQNRIDVVLFVLPLLLSLPTLISMLILSSSLRSAASSSSSSSSPSTLESSDSSPSK